MQHETHKQSPFKVLRTGDPQSLFHSYSPEEILKRLGPPRTLLSSSTKARKSVKVNVFNRVLYLTSGVLCAAATDGCLAACLGHSSGRMQMPSSALARDKRTALFFADREHFLQLLRADLFSLRSEAKFRGMTPAVRLNGTSDVPWERVHPELFAEFKDVQFFDYTKIRPRMLQFLRGHIGNQLWPTNYHLTYSESELHPQAAAAVLEAGGNVAVVFDGSLPKTWRGYAVVDGDQHDARFLDAQPSVIGLSAKGAAKQDQSGFVNRVTVTERRTAA